MRNIGNRKPPRAKKTPAEKTPQVSDKKILKRVSFEETHGVLNITLKATHNENGTVAYTSTSEKGLYDAKVDLAKRLTVGEEDV